MATQTTACWSLFLDGMKKMIDKEIKYCIFDPTGNITALVETEVPAAEQPAAASAVMEKHPEVEQVGFVSFACAENAGTGAADPILHENADGDSESKVHICLRMAGGEFCGNATMCAAALYIIRNRQRLTPQNAEGSVFESLKGNTAAAKEGKKYDVNVRVSGASRPITVRLTENGENSFSAGVDMPPAIGIEERYFECSAKGLTVGDTLSIVHMEGIDHIIVDEYSPFYNLRSLRGEAEQIIKQLCSELGSDCLGMMFMFEEKELVPLVYVPGADTIFWENSCASGTTAAGIWLAVNKGAAVDVSFSEPAGSLRVQSDPKTGKTTLFGNAILISESGVYFQFT